MEAKMSWYPTSIEKRSAWYTPAMDFAAGVDPTGTSTFRLASKYKGGHIAHRAVGDVGGFIGGTALGAALPAAAIGLTALALRKKMPMLSKEFVTAAKGSLDVVNPVKMWRHAKSVPDIVRYKRQAVKVISQSKNLGDKAKTLQSAARTVQSGGKIPTNISQQKKMLNLGRQGERFQKEQDLLQDMQRNMSKKYYDGKAPSEGIARTMTALTTIPAAISTGILNTSSAHMQYGEALKQRRSRGEKIAMLKLLSKSVE
jgi:hypothetical protein